MCASGWTKPWRNKRRPIFEGQWACGAGCLEALVRNATGRELGSGVAATPQESPHRHRLPLGLVMLEQGWITHPQLRRAIDAQKSAGAGKIGEWLQHECGVSLETITRGLGLQWNCRVLSLDGFTPRSMALVMPRLLVEEFGLLPLRAEGSRRLYLGFRDRLDASAAFSLEQMSELHVESGIMGTEMFTHAHERLLDCEFIEATRETMRDTDEMSQKIAEILIDHQPVASRLVRLHRYYWLRTWLEAGAQSRVGMVPASSEDVFDTIFTVGLQN
ncbi:hypothetical protein [Granulicella sibirica]|nr:hypothetical protein [Granulicella sibirica]